MARKGTQGVFVGRCTRQQWYVTTRKTASSSAACKVFVSAQHCHQRTCSAYASFPASTERLATRVGDKALDFSIMQKRNLARYSKNSQHSNNRNDWNNRTDTLNPKP